MYYQKEDGSKFNYRVDLSEIISSFTGSTVFPRLANDNLIRKNLGIYLTENKGVSLEWFGDLNGSDELLRILKTGGEFYINYVNNNVMSGHVELNKKPICIFDISTTTFLNTCNL